MAAGSFANRTEDTVVEALGHVLTASEASRQALQNVLWRCGCDIGPISQVRTQPRLQGGARPDFVGLDPGRSRRVLIEAKFQAGLTGNQPVNYLKHLPPDKPSALLIVAPSQRLETLWAELAHIVSQAEDISLSNEKEDSEIRWGDVGGYRKLILTSWRNLLGRMATEASNAVAQTVNDLHQIQGMAEQTSNAALRVGWLAPEFPRSLPYLYALMDDAVQQLVDKSLATISGYRPMVQRSYSVRYMKLCRISASLGFYIRDWRRYHHRSPSLTLHKEPLSPTARHILTEAPFHANEESTRHLYIPIHLNGMTYSEVLESMVGQIERIADVIKPELGS